METANIFKIRNWAILALFIITAALLIWRFQPEPTNQDSKQIKIPIDTPFSHDGRRIPNSDLRKIPITGKRVSSIAEAEKETGPLKIPARLFGHGAQVFLSDSGLAGKRSATVVYSDKARPTVADGYINIAPPPVRYPETGLVSYEQKVQQGQAAGIPYALRDHKGFPGFTLEKGGENESERPAIVEWTDNGVQYSFIGPLGMGLDELIPIADSID